MYGVEEALAFVLPRLAEAADSGQLKMAFEQHLTETRNHLRRLYAVFEKLTESALPTRSRVIDGMNNEIDEVINKQQKPSALGDLELVMAGQKAEHFEIASYGSLVHLSKNMGLYDISEILATTLAEEKSANARLSDLAESGINMHVVDEIEH